MDKKEVILLVAVIIFAGFRIYQKYFRKDANNRNEAVKKEANSVSSSPGDDYEPYSGNK